MADPRRKLTSEVPNPSGRTNNPIDASVIPYVYEDMRGNHWSCYWAGQGWIARPDADAVAAYGLTDTNNRNEGASDARGLIEQIEYKLEARRIASRDDERAGSWWVLLLIVGGVYYYDKTNRRR